MKKETFMLQAHPFANQHGYNLSIMKFDSKGELITGFTLNNFETRKEQLQIGKDLALFLEIDIDDGR